LVLAHADPERQKECEELLGSLTSERFAELVALGKLITDYVGEGEAVALTDEDRMDEDVGVAVEVSTAVCGLLEVGRAGLWR
jgi:pre-mRNA-splicing helicase BRR2